MSDWLHLVVWKCTCLTGFIWWSEKVHVWLASFGGLRRYVSDWLYLVVRKGTTCPTGFIWWSEKVQVWLMTGFIWWSEKVHNMSDWSHLTGLLELQASFGGCISSWVTPKTFSFSVTSVCNTVGSLYSSRGLLGLVPLYDTTFSWMVTITVSACDWDLG